MDRREEFLEDCIVIDTETTSLEFKIAEVIEFGFGLKFPHGWEIVSHLYTPMEPISYKVSSITNITNKMVDGRPLFKNGAKEDINPVLQSLVGKGSRVAHNAFYDSKVLEKYMLVDLNTPWICTMRWAKKLYAGDATVEEFNLPYLRYRFDLQVPEDTSAHRAGADVLVTTLLVEHLLDETIKRGILEEGISYRVQLEHWLTEPIKLATMPFGKYKGAKLEDVPLDYWMWALNNFDSLNEDADGYDKDFAESVAAVISAKLD
jgi:DNA polymerase III alpha subunit (gram-positive type)